MQTASELIKPNYFWKYLKNQQQTQKMGQVFFKTENRNETSSNLEFATVRRSQLKT